MAAADEVKVILTAENAAYLKSLKDSEAAFNKYMGGVEKASKEGRAYLEKAEKGRVKTAKKTAAGVKKYQELMSETVQKESEKQADYVEDSVDRVKEELSEQQEAYEDTSSGAIKMGKAIRTAALFPLAAVAALTATFTAGMISTLNYADDLNDLANSAGLTAERLQEVAAGSKEYGVSQERVASILEGVKEQTLEYIQTGGGALVDFMEVAGTKAGLTADSFRDLSSDQALGLIFKTLEDGGASQEDFAHFLDSISDGASALVPLLRNGGRELNSFAKEARDAGVILENRTVAGAVSANRAIKKLGDTVRGNVRNAFIEAAPEIEALAETLIELGPVLAEWTKNAVAGIDKVAGAFAKLGQTEAQIFEATPDAGTELYEKDIEGFIKRRDKALKSSLALEAAGNEKAAAKRRAEYEKMVGYIETVEGKIAEVKEREAMKIVERIAKAQKDAADKKAAAAKAAAEKAKRDKDKNSGKGLGSTSKADAAAAILAAEIDAIREVGKLESEQIQELLAERLASIDKAKIADSEKAQLRANVHADAQKELKEIADAEAEFKAQAMADIQAQADADFTANQDRLSFLAEIEATQARMAGRGIEATRIEMEAIQERYEAELAYIEQLIEAKGSTPELEADKANILAGLEENRAARVEFERITLEQIDAMTNNESRLESALEFIDRSEQAKLDRLADYYGQTEALNAEHQEQMNAIETEAELSRTEAKLNSYEDNLTAFQSALSGASQALKDAGKEDSKAAKAIAKVEQVTAIGQAIVNTGQGVTEALKLGPAGIPLAVAIGALGAVQVGVMTAQTFDGGGYTGSGSRTGGVDGKGGRWTITHPNEIIADMTRPGREVNGQSLQSAFGIPTPNIAPPNVSVPALNSISNRSSSISFGDTPITINGNADNAAIARLEQVLANDRRNRAKEFNMMANQRDKRLTSRTERRVGR